ncbi:hypothetical protein [Microbulbifer sp. JMSA003]|uniref:hypothetical protein n=1 Tax=Microbulbifer sp. JMSA003 TaxID=3243369 RepID=UPI00403A140E
MIEFKRYAHIEDLLLYYAKSYKDDSILKILKEGVNSTSEAEEFSLFIWWVVDSIHDDQENEIEIMSSAGNLEMLPDLEYEISDYMQSVGFYDVWCRVSKQA